MKHSKISSANIDALMVAASVALAEKNSEYLNSVDLSGVCISQKTDTRVLKSIKKEQKSKPTSFYRRISKVATILLVISVAALTFCMSVEAVRAELWNSIVTFFEEHIGIHLEVNELDTPSFIETKREPSLQPKGTTSTVIVDNPVAYFVSYTIDEVEVMFYQQSPFTEQSAYTDNECVVTDIKVNGNDATLFEYLNSDKCYMIVWFDGQYIYMLDSFSEEITLEELVTIAESVR